MLLRLLLVSILIAASPACAQQAPGQGRMVTGFNQAWLHGSYGHQWISGFDAAEARRLLQGCRTGGATVIRMWLFEGLSPEGVLWDGQQADTAGASARGRPTGIDRRKLENLDRFLALAEESGIRVYLTLFDANIYRFPDSHFEARRDEWWNVLNDKYQAGTGFLDNVMKPVSQVLARHPRAVFALDLVNELNALVRAHWFEKDWQGAATFVDRWRRTVRAITPVPVGASFGHADAVDCLLARKLPDPAVDFWDVHAYDDAGAIKRAAEVKAFAAGCGKPVFLGEFGQLSPSYDDALQQRVTAAFIRNARSLGFAAALAWRLSDVRPGQNPEARLSYEAFGRWRPAMDTFRQVSAE